MKFSHFNETRLTLQYHEELNPRLWSEFQLKPDVRSRLLDLAYMWSDYAKIPGNIIADVIMTGGNVNYNYTTKSDIDVHLLIDRGALGLPPEFIDEYLQDKKTLWSIKNHITVYNYPIEFYAQDVHDGFPVNQGIFSLKSNAWLQMPIHLQIDFQNDKFLKRKVISMIHQIDTMFANPDPVAFKQLHTRLKDMRSASIAKEGEFGFDNQVFKELRNRGYLDKITKYMAKLKDDQYSLK